MRQKASPRTARKPTTHEVLGVRALEVLVWRFVKRAAPEEADRIVFAVGASAPERAVEMFEREVGELTLTPAQRKTVEKTARLLAEQLKRK